MNKLKKRLTDQQKIEIVEKYKTGKYTCASLGREYAKAPGSINKLLKVRGVEIINRGSGNKKYVTNENYFDKIDTEDKAYFLGLMYADGCVHTKTTRVALSLQEADVEILHKFSQFLESTQPLRIEKRKEKHPTWQDAYILALHSQKLKQSLIALGCVPRKTHVLKFPTEDQVPSHLIRHFIRGYFDGDGSFSYNYGKDKCHRLIAKIVGNFDLLEKLQLVWNSLVNIKSHICSTGATPNIVQLSVGGRESVLKLLRWLYLDCTVYLKRKYDKFNNLENFLIENNLDKTLEAGNRYAKHTMKTETPRKF